MVNKDEKKMYSQNCEVSPAGHGFIKILVTLHSLRPLLNFKAKCTVESYWNLEMHAPQHIIQSSYLIVWLQANKWITLVQQRRHKGCDG